MKKIANESHAEWCTKEPTASYCICHVSIAEAAVAMLSPKDT